VRGGDGRSGGREHLYAERSGEIEISISRRGGGGFSGKNKRPEGGVETSSFSFPQEGEGGEFLHKKKGGRKRSKPVFQKKKRKGCAPHRGVKGLPFRPHDPKKKKKEKRLLHEKKRGKKVFYRRERRTGSRRRKKLHFVWGRRRRLDLPWGGGTLRRGRKKNGKTFTHERARGNLLPRKEGSLYLNSQRGKGEKRENMGQKRRDGGGGGRRLIRGAWDSVILSFVVKEKGFFAEKKGKKKKGFSRTEKKGKGGPILGKINKDKQTPNFSSGGGGKTGAILGAS